MNADKLKSAFARHHMVAKVIQRLQNQINNTHWLYLGLDIGLSPLGNKYLDSLQKQYNLQAEISTI